MAGKGEIGPGTVVKDDSSSSGGRLIKNSSFKMTSRPSNGAEFGIAVPNLL